MPDGWFEGTDPVGKMVRDRMSYHRVELAPGASTTCSGTVDGPESDGYKGRWRAEGVYRLSEGAEVSWSLSGTCP